MPCWISPPYQLAWIQHGGALEKKKLTIWGLHSCWLAKPAGLPGLVENTFCNWIFILFTSSWLSTLVHLWVMISLYTWSWGTPLKVQFQLPSFVICPPHFSIISTCHFGTSCPIIRHLVFSHDYAPLRNNILLTTIKHIVCYWIGTSCSAMMVRGSLNQVLLN